MKILDNFIKTLKGLKTTTEKTLLLPPSEPKGYFNGVCPHCKNHIGVWVILEYYWKQARKKTRHTVTCPCCGNEIFEDVKDTVEWGRI